MSRRPYDAKLSQRTYHVLYGVIACALVLMTGYLAVRVTTVLTDPRTSTADAAMAVLLLGAELFLCMHGVGFYRHLVNCGRRQARSTSGLFSRHVRPPVAVLVAAFDEPEYVLDETLAAVRAMDYPVSIYLLDDSTNPDRRDGAERVAGRYGARFVHRTDRTGYKAGAINELIPQLTETYIALLDADQRPSATWLSEMVAYLEEDPRVAFVQTPQRYANTEGLPVCETCRYEQSIFYEYICEGKSLSNAAACCGSNCVLRREALLSIATVRNGRTNYFDETSVTEDFVTTVLLHMKGWRTEYVNNLYVVGMGPETLPAYFTQQARWAMGTMSYTRRIIPDFLRNPRAMRPAQWWEHWLVSTFYYVGWAQFIFILAPIAFAAADVQAIRTFSQWSWLFFLPYFACALGLFFFGMRLRGYPVRRMWLATALSFATFWVYMKAAVVATFGLRRAFRVTPKGVGGAIPLKSLWMELTMFVGCVTTSGWCIYGAITSAGAPAFAYAVNGIWATYHAALLAPLFFYFNKRVTVRPRPSLFQPYGVAEGATSTRAPA